MKQPAVDFSLCVDPGQDTSYLESMLHALPFTVNVTALPWESSWRRFTDYAVYQQGADASQVGAPLVGDLIAMNALRPFTGREMAQLGGEAAFEPVAWQSANRVMHGQVWAVPWTADLRVLFYWRDMLEQAGIDETTAFHDLERMEVTLDRLQVHGLESPWALPTAHPLAAIQTAASWVWGAGGSFVHPDGKRVLFCDPPAMEGWRRYFSLNRYMPPKDQPISPGEALALFTSRQAAVTMGSLHLGTQIWESISPQAHLWLGIAPPPGPALVGGSSLVVWAYTRREREAAALTAYLSNPAAMSEHCQRTGYLPTRLDVLSSPPFSTDGRFRMYAQALQSGRPFPVIKAGGLLENSLAASLTYIWQDILNSGGGEIQSPLEKHLFPLGRRLDITLSQF
jgi:multiple sugar transport system substrate-binding protein